MLLATSELQQDQNFIVPICELLQLNCETDSFDIYNIGKGFGKTIPNISISVISAITNSIFVLNIYCFGVPFTILVIGSDRDGLFLTVTILVIGSDPA